MVEDIRLDALVIHPHHRIRKEIEFHRQSRLRRLQLAHHQGHPLVDRHLIAQVSFQIGTKHPEVGLVQAVDLAFTGADAMRGIVFLNPLLSLVDIFADDVYVAVPAQHVRRTEFHARHVQVHRTLHAAAARRLHSAPVLERIAHQQVGRQRNDRIVPVLHFDGRERHLDHRTVRTVFGYGDPVPDLEHVVRRKLDARDEAEDAVAEDQHDDGRRSAQSGEQNGGRLADQDRDDEDTADQRCDSLPGLAQSVDRFVLPRRTRRDDIEGRIKQGVDKTEDRDDDVHLYQSCDNRPGFRLFIENYGEDDDQHDSADDITQPAQHGGTEQFVIPRGFGAHHDAPNPAHEHRTAQEIEKHDGQHYQGESHPTIPAASRASAQRVRRDCIRYFYQISDLTAFVIISDGNPGDRITTAEGKNPATAITIEHASVERHQSLRLAPVCAGQCPATYRTVASLSVSRLQYTKKNYTPSTSSTSPSKLGVKTPLPRFSKISSRLQKRPPSSSSLGTTSPSYTVRWT